MNATESDGEVKLELRYAGRADMRSLWIWANDPDTRRSSFSTDTIPWDNHIKWFNACLQDDDTVIYIVSGAEVGDIGTVRFTIVRSGEADISITIAPERRGERYSRMILNQALSRYFSETRVDMVHAYVKAGNIASQKAFLSTGFIHAERTKVHGCDAEHYTVLRKQYD